MTLYEISDDIMSLIDDETGEITDYAEFERLCALKDDKIEAMGIVYKQMLSYAESIKAERDRLDKRMKSAEATAERIKFMLSDFLGGQKYKTAKIDIGWRKSEAVQIDDEAKFIYWAKLYADQYLKYKEPEISKSAIKDALKGGIEVPGATIKTKNNISIK